MSFAQYANLTETTRCISVQNVEIKR